MGLGWNAYAVYTVVVVVVVQIETVVVVVETFVGIAVEDRVK